MAETVSEPSIAYSTSAAATMITTISTLSSPMATGDEAAVSVDPVAVLPTKLPRDSSWLELEICRDFVRGCCNYNADECRFAHPEPGVITKGDKATCCYDFLKDRCHRERCKYFHPPLHIKQKLVAAGKQFGAMMSNAYMLPGVTYPMSPALSPASSVVPVVGPDGQLMSSPMHGSYLPAAAVFPPWEAMNDRLLICPEFVRGVCNIPLCPFVHPGHDDVTCCRAGIRLPSDQPRCAHPHRRTLPYHHPRHVGFDTCVPWFSSRARTNPTGCAHFRRSVHAQSFPRPCGSGPHAASAASPVGSFFLPYNNPNEWSREC